MCGIAGKLALDGQTPVDRRLLERMTRSLAHRGPDGEGCYLQGPVGLGHRRLAIIGLDPSGAQPMSNEDGTVWVSFNGEIYNHRALRRELEQRGHVFRSQTDTEVIVHLYEEHGDDCVDQLRGMFAFAIWDVRRQRLFIARDRVGIKPLYYTRSRDALLFASEIKALMVDPGVERRIRPAAIDRFLSYYYLPGEQTLFEGIHRLPPGHCMTVARGRITVRRYWDLSFTEDPRWRHFDDAVGRLQELLSATVGSHLASDVPVGVLLSGGVDSTAMLGEAARQLPQAPHSFTVGFDGESFADERPYARLAAQAFGSRHEEITLSPEDFGALLPLYTWHMEEPVCEPPAIALYAVARQARRAGVKVLLSGEGGDEAFGGYNKYAYLVALEQMKAAFGPARGLLRWGMAAGARLGAPSLRHYTALVQPPLGSHYLSCTSNPGTPFNRQKHTLYRADFAAGLIPGQADEPTRRLFARQAGLPLLHRLLQVDTKTWLPDDLLIKADKMTMATSVELRVPLLDSDLLEFAASLPAGHKLRGWPPKRVLRTALRGQVPQAILQRRKLGFPVPYGRWLRHELRDQVHAAIDDPRGVLRDCFEPAALRVLVAAQRPDGEGAQEVFSLLVLDLLDRQFIHGRDLPQVQHTPVDDLEEKAA
jgi:asparagine synthase (glutamine-hydrolysing)